VFAQSTSHFQLTAENDIFNPFNVNMDRYYTHGTAFSYITESPTEKQSYTLGQDIFTPSAKRPNASVEILNSDRPYSGWLYAEYRDTKFVSETMKDTYGIQLGCVGPCSLAKQSQLTVHRAIGDKLPTWDRNYVQKSEPGIILELERSILLHKNQYSDLAVYAAGKAGNIIDNVAFGADYRVGYNLSKFSSDPIIFKIDKNAQAQVKDPLTFYFFTRAEQRVVAYNHLLEGSLWQNERHTVTAEPFVQELDAGFTVGWDVFSLTYRYTFLSNEWKEHQGSYAFGGITLTFG
jgi:hypothetical protein